MGVGFTGSLASARPKQGDHRYIPLTLRMVRGKWNYKGLFSYSLTDLTLTQNISVIKVN
jgi:hypothetical protein